MVSCVWRWGVQVPPSGWVGETGRHWRAAPPPGWGWASQTQVEGGKPYVSPHSAGWDSDQVKPPFGCRGQRLTSEM
jgi:hypothetical protein